MPKFVFWIGGGFLFAGLALLAGAGWAENSARRFEAGAERGSGTVIDLARRTSDDGGYTYAPVVEWRDASGTRQEFVGGVASSPPSYDRGEAVAVLYPPGQPGRARIADFTNRYFLPLLLGGMGAVFSLVGGGIAFYYVRRQREIAHLQNLGLPIAARFVETYRDTSVSINGRHPWRAVAQAVHPATGKLCRFESGPLWVDPAEALAGRTVRVLVDPHDPDSHFVDLSGVVDPDDMG